MKNFGKLPKTLIALLLTIVMLLGTVLPAAAQTAAGVGTMPISDGGAPGETGEGGSYDIGWFEVTYDNDELKITLTPDIKALLSTGMADISGIVDALVEALKLIVTSQIEAIFADDAPETRAVMLSARAVPTISTSKWDKLFKAYAEKYYPEGGVDELIDDIVSGESKVIEAVSENVASIINVAVAFGYIDADDLPKIETDENGDPVDESLEALKTDIVDQFSGYVAEKKGCDVEEVKESVGAFAETFVETYHDTVNVEGESLKVGLWSIFKALENVKIGNRTVFADGAVKLNGIKALIKDLPRPSEIANWSNDEMFLSWPVEVNTKLGDVKFDVTLAIGGGYDEIREIARLVSEYIDVSYDDGVITLDVRVPAKFASYLRRACASESIPKELKDKIFSKLDASVDDIYAIYCDLTFDEIITLLKNINFENILDKDFIKQYVDLTGYDNADIIAKIEQYEGLFNKVNRRLLSLAEKVYNRIPERYKSKTLVDLYRGNGLFTLDVSASLSRDEIKKVIDEIVPAKYKEYVDFAFSYVKFDEITLGLDASVIFADIGKIEYYVGDSLEPYRVGFLPKGATIADFAGIKSYQARKIIGWVDENGNELDKMSGADTKAYAVLDIQANAILLDGEDAPAVNVNAVYNAGTTYTLAVNVENLIDPDQEFDSVTYQWYKDGVAIAAAESSIEIQNVADSGAYYCKVTITDGNNEEEVTTNTVTITVTPAKIDFADVAWGTLEFLFSGNDHTVSINGVDGTLFDIVPTGNVNSAVGTHTATVTVSFKGGIDPTNYEVINNTFFTEANGVYTATTQWTVYDRAVVELDEDDINRVFDGNTTNITATVTGTTVTGKWQKFVNNAWVDTAISGAMLSVRNVSDSGKYRYIVNVTEGVAQEAYAEIIVAITAATVNVDDFTWSALADIYTYNREVQTPDLSENNIPAYVSVNYSDTLSGKKPGTYNVTANFALAGTDAGNYVLSETSREIGFTIDKAVFDHTGIHWNYNGDITYDGNAHTVKLVGFEEYTDVIAKYTGDTSKTEAGNYSVTFTGFVVLDGSEECPLSDYYTETGLPATYANTVAWVIKVAGGQVTPPVVDHEHKVNGNVIVKVTDENGVLSEYSINVTTPNAVAAGNKITLSDGAYTVLAAYDIIFKNTDNEEPTYGTDTFTVEITIPAEHLDKDIVVIYYDEDGNAQHEKISATKVDGKMVFDVNHFSIYALAVADPAPTPPGPTPTPPADEGVPPWVWILVGALIAAAIAVVVFLIIKKKKDGESATETTEEPVAEEETEAPVEEAPIAEVIEEPELEAVEEPVAEEVVEETAPEAELEEPAELVIDPVLEIICDIDAEEEPVVEEAAPEAEVEEVVEETAPEAEVEEVVEEAAPEAEVVETEADIVEAPIAEVEEVVEETAPEAEVEEVVEEAALEAEVEEVVEDTAPEAEVEEVVEETAPEAEVVETEADIVEAPIAEVEEVVEETAPEVEVEEVVEDTAPEAEVEEVVEETAPEAEVEEVVEEAAPEAEVEEVVEETAPEAEVEEVVEETAPEAEVEEVVEEAAPEAIADAQVVLVRYRSSFMSRYIQSEGNVQDYYTVIKNTLLSYKGVKARTSWNCEAFNKGRIQCAKINIKGRALIVYLALNPNDYVGSKYHFNNVSGKPKFNKVPMMIKVRSDRALKYALELITEMMAKLEIAFVAEQNVDYHMPYETTEELVAKDLIKVILPRGMALDANANVVKADVSEMLENAKAEATPEVVEETAEVVEEAAEVVEETADVVEEITEVVEETAEVVEETAEVVEETAEVVEEIAEVVEEAEVVHVDAVHADELVTDEEAAASIEIIKSTAKSSGKMCEINLDTICENFEDGETVTLAELKRRKLVNGGAGRVKVLARGIMDKKLTVIADKFSLQAVKMITLAGGHAEQIK